MYFIHIFLLSFHSCYLVKVNLHLVKLSSQSVSSLYINHVILHFTQQSLLGLLQRSTLGVQSFNLFLSLLQMGGKLFPVENDNYAMRNYENKYQKKRYILY